MITPPKHPGGRAFSWLRPAKGFVAADDGEVLLASSIATSKVAGRGMVNARIAKGARHE
jgi:hypothetical protein